MKKQTIVLVLISVIVLLFISIGTYGQSVIISENATPTSDPSALLELESSSQGFLPPQMTRNQRDAIASPAAGLMIYNTDDNVWQGYNGTSWVYVDGSSCAPDAPSAIIGASFVSLNATGKVYTTTAVTGANSYSWTVPTGASITAGAGTTSITVDFGNADGNVSVCAVSDGCGSSANTELAISVGLVNIGDNYQGGVIAYILEPGDAGYDSNVAHGIIVSKEHQGLAIWGCVGTDILAADDTSLGSGLSNTSAIVGNCPTAGIAALLCLNYTNADTGTGVYSDWYLPSKDELNKLWINRAATSCMIPTLYWSSTQDDSNNAWYQYFDLVGTQYLGPKDDLSEVKAIRTF